MEADVYAEMSGAKADDIAIQMMKEVLTDMDITPATASTEEYYMAKKNKSYPINTEHERRGRALIVTMTEKREGWRADIKKLHHMFQSLRVDTEHIFDPNSMELFEKLQQFARDGRNDNIDCSFVVLMGHGFSDGNNTYLRTTDLPFDIWQNCRHVFSSDESRLKDKPKVVICQMCRKQAKYVADSAFPLTKTTFKDYIFLLPCNPNEFAYRDDFKGSCFIQTLSDHLMQDSHCQHVEKVMKKVSASFEEKSKTNPEKTQIPQQRSSLTKNVNIFPGINSGKIHPTNTELGEEQDHKGTDNKKENKKEKETRDSTSPNLRITMDPMVKPECDSVSDKVVNDIVRHLKTKEGGDAFTEYMSKELETNLKIADITTGSIHIDWFIEDLAELENIKLLSDSGVLTNLVTYFLVKPELRQRCSADKIILKTVVDENSYQAILVYALENGITVDTLLTQMPDKNCFLGEEVEIKAEINQGEVKWMKDNVTITNSENICIESTDEHSTLTINHVKEENGGLYRCVSGRGTRRKTSDRYLYVHDFGVPRDVRATVSNPFSVLVMWKTASGSVDAYKVYAFPEEEDHKVLTKACCDANQNYTIINGLKPNTFYKIGLTSVSEETECTLILMQESVKTPGFHHVILEHNMTLLKSELKLESILEKMTQKHEEQDILSSESNDHRIQKFAEWLQWRPPEDYKHFIKLLYKTQQATLAGRLVKSYAELSDKDVHDPDNEPEESDVECRTDESPHSVSDPGDLFVKPEVQGITEKPSNAADIISKFINSLREKQPFESYAPSTISKDTGYYSELSAESEKTGSVSDKPEEIIAIVLYPHTARDDDELSLSVTDVVRIIECSQTGWWTGELRGRQGHFPSNCVQIVNLAEIIQHKQERTGVQHLHKSEVRKAIALRDYEADNENELTIHKGDSVVVLEQEREDWWMGYNKGKIGLFPSEYVQEETLSDDLMVKFVDGWLKINKINRDLPGRPTLSEKRWREVADKVNPLEVKVIEIQLIDYGDCIEPFFTFTSKCINCIHLKVNIVPDTTERNHDLSHHLSLSLQHLHALLYIDVRRTKLGEGWGEVLSTISSPHLRVLTLFDNNMCGNGGKLGEALTSLPQLRSLGLSESGLKGEELLAVLSLLPSNCPLLQSLNIEGHDLSEGADRLVPVFDKLPNIRVLIISNCKVPGLQLAEIIKHVKTKIEVLSIRENGSITDDKDSVFEHIEQFKSLLYMNISSSQITPADISQLHTMLSQHGGCLLVAATPDHPLWKVYIKQIVAIRDQCLSS